MDLTGQSPRGDWTKTAGGKRRAFLLALVAIAVGTPSCDDAPSAPSQSYPTTYPKLSNQQLDSLRAEFAIENPDNCSTLDNYGFPERPWQCGSSGEGPCASVDSLIAAGKSDLVRNRRFAGLAHSDELEVDRAGCGAGPPFYIRFSDQVYEGLEVFFTEMMVEMDEAGVNSIVGHHYPEIYVPDPLVTSRSAQESTLGLKIIWYDLTGQPHEYIVTKDSWNGEPFRVIYPIVLENRIDLHVAWCVPAAGWRVYVDTMTRERIAIQQLFRT